MGDQMKQAIFCVCTALALMLPHISTQAAGPEEHGEVCMYPDAISVSGSVAGKPLMQPSGFVQNEGQYGNPLIAFSSRTSSCSVLITKSGDILYNLSHQDYDEAIRGLVLEESFVNQANGCFHGLGSTGTTVSYFKGSDPKKWKSGLPCYEKVVCSDIYPGIDLSLVANGETYEKVFTIGPGASADQIRIAVSGVERLRITEDGDLECHAGEQVCFSRPFAYQVIDGIKSDIAVRYSVDELVYGFEVDDYNPGYPLIIDPLISSTFFGGSSFEEVGGQLLSSDGTVYIGGFTRSSDFPMVPGAYDETHNGGDEDIFISRLDADLTSLISSTYIGGNDEDVFMMQAGILQHENGDIYICGGSSSDDFPTTDGAYSRSNRGQLEGIIFFMNADLTTLKASTYIGGTGDDVCKTIALSDDGAIYVSGETIIYSSFPTTKGAFDQTHNGSWDMFITSFDSTLSAISASTLLGGHLYERSREIYLDDDGNVIVAGVTISDDYPVTPGAYDETFNGVGSWPDYDFCVSTLNGSLTELLASTFIGGKGTDEFHDMEIDGETIVLVGESNSWNFPTTEGVIATEKAGHYDVVVSRLDMDLTTLIASTFINGPTADFGYATAITDQGYVYVAGSTYADRQFPTTPGAYQENMNLDFKDAIILRIDKEFKRYTAATILGGHGSSVEECNDIDWTEDGRIYVSGITEAPDFPTTPGVIFEDYQGGGDCFISILDELLTLHAGKLVVAPGPGYGNSPLVRVYPVAQDSYYGFEFTAFGSPHYGANVCCGDVNGDEYDEILVGAGPGEVFGAHVRGFEIDGDPIAGLSFFAYGTHRFGVNVATGDIDGDGYDEIITGAGPGAVFGPHVRAFDYDGTPGVVPVPGVSYFAYGTPKWGVNVSAGDIDGDGFDEILTGAGPGAVYGPHVRGWNVDGGTVSAIHDVSYFAYATLKYGVNVSVGDVDGDGIDEIVTGAGPGQVFGAHVRGWNYDGGSVAPLPGFSFFAWHPSITRYGAKVCAGADLDDDGRTEIVVGPGPDPAMGTQVRAYRYSEDQISEWFNLESFPGLSHGASVAAGRF
jgi:hypothetical protein